MTKEAIHISIDVVQSAIEQRREFLEERIDPDSGLLDKLLANGNLSRKKHSEVKGKSSSYERISELLDYILKKHRSECLVKALLDTEQKHIVNYLNANAEYKSDFGGEWPLTENEISILDTNQESLVELLELTDLLGHLYSAKVVNKRQMVSILSESNPYKKNETLIEILRRRSLNDFRKTITCLHQTKQSHIAEILDKGGVVLRLHANLDEENVTETENEVVKMIADILISNSIVQPNRILELAHNRVIAAKTGQSVVLYIYCKTIEELQQLHESFSVGHLRDSVELWFNRLLTRSQKITVAALKVSDDAFQKMQTYFKEEEIGRQALTVRHSGYAEVIKQHNESNVLVTGDITVRATADFDHKQMRSTQKSELKKILQLQRGREDDEDPSTVDSEQKDRGSATSDSDESDYSYDEVNPNSDDDEDPSTVDSEQEDRGSAKSDSDESDYSYYEVNPNSDDEVNPCAMALTFKRGDKMKTIPPANIGDNIGWWMVRLLDSEQIGFIPRNRVVIDLIEDQPVRADAIEDQLKTSINQLPLELLDIILRLSFLHNALSGEQSGKKIDEFLLMRLSSVDLCWFQRITKRRFKKTIGRHLSKFYEEFPREIIIFRTNRSYLEENIQPKGLISRLRSFDCLTDMERRLLSRQRLIKSTKILFRKRNNPDLLHVVRFFDDAKRSDFIRCLRKSKQTLPTRVAENGGVVLKTIIVNPYTAKRQLLDQRVNDIGDKNKPRSHQMEKLISQLQEADIEILNSVLDRQTVVWIWCQSPKGLEEILRLNESDSLTHMFTELTPLSSSTETNKTIAVSICRDQLTKSGVLCPTSVKFIKRLDMKSNEVALGVTKLRNEIYVLCLSDSTPPPIIRVFEDHDPFRLLEKIEINQIRHPKDIGSSEKDNCLYVLDLFKIFVWKITGETDDQHEDIESLNPYIDPTTLSVSSDGQLLITYNSPSILETHRSGTNGFDMINLGNKGIKNPIHAVETRIGNFIILHEGTEKEGEGESWSSGTVSERKWGISEVTSNGQMVVRRFTSSNETQKLKDPTYLSIAPGDRVFVADFGNHRVILLDSDLKWNRIICPTKEENERRINLPYRLHYDKETNQFIVGGDGVNVYTPNGR